MSPWYAVRCVRCGREKYPTAPTHPGPGWVCHTCTVTGGPSEAKLQAGRDGAQKARLAKSFLARPRLTVEGGDRKSVV